MYQKGKHDWKRKYLRNLTLDIHIGDQAPEFLGKLDPDELVEMLKLGNINIIYLYSKSHWGLNLYECKVGPKHPALGDKDFFDSTLKKCKENGIKVICYYSLGYDEYWLDRNKNDAMKDPVGQGLEIVPVFGTTGLWRFVCINSPYRDYALAQIREITEKYRFDAFYMDILGSPYGCRCCHCKKQFRKATGREIPQNNDWKNPVMKQYARWAEDAWTDFLKEATDLIHKKRPDVPVSHNMCLAQFMWGLNISDTGDVNDFLTIEAHQEMTGWGTASFNPKILRAAGNGKQFDIYINRFTAFWDWTLKPKVQFLAEAFTVTAHGGAVSVIDHINPDGTLEPAVYKAIGDVFGEIEKREEWLFNARPVNYAAVHFSLRNRMLAGYPTPEIFFEPVCGAFQMLTEEHVPFEFVFDKHLTEEILSNYELLIMPCAVALDDSEAAAIGKYVENGGVLVCCDTVGTLDGRGRKRRNGTALGRVLGLDFEGCFDRTTYFRLDEEGRKPRETVPSLPLVSTVRTAKVKLAPGAAERVQLRGKIIESYRLDPKRIKWVTHGLSPAKNETDRPVMAIGSYGKGRFAYFAGNPFGSYGKNSFNDHRAMFMDVYKEVTKNRRPPVETNAPSCVETVLNRQDAENRWIIHFINFQPETGRPVFMYQSAEFPMKNIPSHPFLLWVAQQIRKETEPLFNRLIDLVQYPGYEPPHVIKEIIPVHNIEVKIRMPKNKRVKTAYLAPSMEPIKWVKKNGALCFLLEKIEINSILVLEFMK